jgi:hypothetical protein
MQKKFTLLHADFSKIVLKYSNEVHLLRYLTLLTMAQCVQEDIFLDHLPLVYRVLKF